MAAPACGSRAPDRRHVEVPGQRAERPSLGFAVEVAQSPDAVVERGLGLLQVGVERLASWRRRSQDRRRQHRQDERHQLGGGGRDRQHGGGVPAIAPIAMRARRSPLSPTRSPTQRAHLTAEAAALTCGTRPSRWIDASAACVTAWLPPTFRLYRDQSEISVRESVRYRGSKAWRGHGGHSR